MMAREEEEDEKSNKKEEKHKISFKKGAANTQNIINHRKRLPPPHFPLYCLNLMEMTSLEPTKTTTTNHPCIKFLAGLPSL